jgi:hypothetical protein
MAEQMQLTTEETTALDRIDAELKGFAARPKAAAEGVENLCEQYHKIRAYLLILIKIVRKIPVYGEKIATALEFLMGLADAVCPA